MLLPKLHADEVDIDTEVVRALVAEHVPAAARERIEPVAAPGTDNVTLRLGDDLVVRLPRIEGAAATLRLERRWLPVVAPHLPVATPLTIVAGEPGHGYPFPWSVSRWIEGSTPDAGHGVDPEGLARDLAACLRALASVPVVAEAPVVRRGGPFGIRVPHTDEALAECGGLLDLGRTGRAWHAVADVPEWSGAPQWLHTDLMPGNLLVGDGRLTGVIDFAPSVGDPAVDLIPAWFLLDPHARAVFREALELDEGTWLRGRAWAMSIALVALPYYAVTDPRFAAVNRVAVDAVVTDVESD